MWYNNSGHLFDKRIKYKKKDKETVMELFKKVPSNFFGILASPNKEIYIQALLALYKAFQTEWSIRQDTLIVYLIDELDELVFNYALDETEENEVKEKNSSAYAHLILRKLKDTAWIELEMGTVDFIEYISIPDYSYKIIEVLYEIISDEADTEYNRYVYSTYSVLKMSKENNSDYKTAIDSSYEQTKALFDKLKLLYNNIRRYHRQLASHHETNQILSEHFDEFKENLADKIYHPIKTFDSVHRFKTPILAILKDWLYDNEILEKIADEAWIRERKKSESETDFKEKTIENAKEKLVKIIDIYESMDQLLKEIDKKNTEYTKATFDRIDFLLNTDRSIKGKLKEIIKTLSADNTEKWNDKINDSLNFSPQLILDENSLYSPRKTKKRKLLARDKVREISDNSAILSEVGSFKKSVKELYSKQKVQEYMLGLLDEKDYIEAKTIPINEDRDYVKTILSVIDNDDKKSKYSLDFKDGEVDKDSYIIPDFVVKRNKKND